MTNLIILQVIGLILSSGPMPVQFFCQGLSLFTPFFQHLVGLGITDTNYAYYLVIF